MPLDLPSRKNMALTIDNGQSEDYHLVRLYYSLFTGWFYRSRLRVITQLLEGESVDRILDVGTGSGILIKELLKRAGHVTGIDLHSTYRGVTSMLANEGVNLNQVELRQGSILNIPYGDETFDIVVCVSVLEHFADPRPALQEIRRVLKPNGIFVAGFPARNRLTAILFQMLGYNDQEIHPASHELILRDLHDTFRIDKVSLFPSHLLKMYVACRAGHPDPGNSACQS